MRSLSVKSAIVLMVGLRALRKNGCADSAVMPLTARAVFAVLAHRVTRPGTPPDTRSTEPDSSASFIMSGPLKVSHDTLTSPSPAALVCFSISFWCSIVLICR